MAPSLFRRFPAVVNLPLAAPFAVLVVSSLAALAYHQLGYHYGQNSMGPLSALYTVAVHRSAAVSIGTKIRASGPWRLTLA
ncbi:hypothetical protein FHU36_004263 [Nonomuraea muscovyensis]|uniref:Uncharacterized protein n=1 Tax=Nonomuraea muscovyensis TaxID=1124761 RepID=A0A7X0EXK7_9ACTN|nr:hypothetical protein [Nonomuraea muscovyensis]MBB6347718.1 hypothetical protein [Nonomuraea muscovyensis]